MSGNLNMKIYYTPKSHIDIGNHVFPTIKYPKIHQRLIKTGIAKTNDFVEPAPANIADLLLIHTPEFIAKLREGTLSAQELEIMEFPYDPSFFDVLRICVQGTIDASLDALNRGIGIHLGGGYHHAYPDHGEGFCIVNDLAITTKKLIKEKRIAKAMIVDCDLHQGNGTAAALRGDSSIFTFSIHERDTYPFESEQSSLDIGLPGGTRDQEYLTTLQSHYPQVLDSVKPDLVIYQAGADPYKEDMLGSLELTMAGLKQRDQYIIGQARKRKIPLAVTLGGGYALDVEEVVSIHAETIKVAIEAMS